jgi:4-diphosphocytidyl-2-C-methyl-D-erythritol kinase
VLSERAPAKINLALHVEGRRADGYHLLDTLVVFTDAGDRLGGVAVADAAQGLDISGPFAAGLPAGRDNLIWRATDALFAAVGFGADNRQALSLHLEKQLPVASGIGGGSADAAATLRLVNRMLDLGMDEARLAEIALSLGADVPMCVYSRAIRARGIGEEIAFVGDLPRLNLVLANPGSSLATPAVFAERKGAMGMGLGALPRFADAGGLATWLAGTRNDLEEAACRLAPPVQAVLDVMASRPGCLLARMSGSGGTVFGIFTDEAAAEGAAREISGAEPGWWVKATGTL